jgi:hypothetical protein
MGTLVVSLMFLLCGSPILVMVYALCVLAGFDMF